MLRSAGSIRWSELNTATVELDSAAAMLDLAAAVLDSAAVVLDSTAAGQCRHVARFNVVRAAAETWKIRGGEGKDDVA
jgi:hypothetical protein